MGELLRLENVSKSYGPVQALRRVDLRVEGNEVVGLLGDNGAGKSTLVKILAGVLAPDTGTMAFDGARVDLARYTGSRARSLGIETVHQDHAIGVKQPMWRNVFVGRHRRTPLGFIRVAEEKRETLRLVHDVLGLPGGELDAEAPADVLSGGERQGLAIGRAMFFQSRLLILDEPTSALSLAETEKVLGFIRGIRESGRTCIFISHTLTHVYAVADRFVIMDRGSVAAEVRRSEQTLSSLTDLLLSLHQGRPVHG
jgi:simple sugar transport system ATP-binding protein